MQSRTHAIRSLSALGAIGILLTGAFAASAENLALQPRYRPGDTYRLSLSAVTDAQVRSSGGQSQRSESEDVTLRYEATVVVLETDGTGLPIREVHEAVDLTYKRPGESGSLFGPGTKYEVRRTGGDVQLYARGERVAPKIEKIVAQLLENQFEYTIAALVDPGRPVEVGESWPLDRTRVEQFLESRGVRHAELDEPATATLEKRGPSDQLAVVYRIPIDEFELAAMPDNSRRSRSGGELSGEVELATPASGRSLTHVSKLALEMRGAAYAPGFAHTVPWSYRQSKSLSQSTRPVTDVAVLTSDK